MGDRLAIEEEARLASSRVHRLAAVVEAEEAALVRTTLAEAELAADAHGRLPAQQSSTTEGQLTARVMQAQQLLADEHAKLRETLADPNVQLALAVNQGVDGYYGDVHALRHKSNPASVNKAAPTAALSKLKKERERLADAVRTLAIETEGLAREARNANESKAALAEALRRRDLQRGANFRY